MSNYPNSHLYSDNNIYKIVLSMEDLDDTPLKNNEDKSKYINYLI